jgi:NADH-quinone oxidoreductase subunit N
VTRLAGLAAAPPAIAPPHIEYWQLSPMLLVFAVAVAGVLVEAFVPRAARRSLHLGLALGGLAGAFGLTIAVGASSSFSSGTPGHVVAMGAVGVDGPTLFIQGTILVLAFVSVLLLAESSHDVSPFVAQAAAIPGSAEEREGQLAGITHTEVYPLTLFAVAGMLLFPAANDLLTMFVALEVLSLPLYLLCGLAWRRPPAVPGGGDEVIPRWEPLVGLLPVRRGDALRVLRLGGPGCDRLGGVLQHGQLHVAVRGHRATRPRPALQDRRGAVPGLEAGRLPGRPHAGHRAHGVLHRGGRVRCAAARVLRSVRAAGRDWRPAMWVIAILTMVVGAIIAITQTDVKRLLAYSSIAHAGFILTGVVAASTLGLSSSLFYLAVYGLTTIGAFAVVTLVRDATGEAAHLRRWAGLGKRSPVLAGIFAFFLLAFAGIPLTSGFTGKFAVFQAAIAGGALPLVIVGVLSSAVAAFFYVRVIVLMFFSDPAPDGPSVVTPGVFTGTAVAIGAVTTLVFGVIPGPLLNLANHAASHLFVR